MIRIKHFIVSAMFMAVFMNAVETNATVKCTINGSVSDNTEIGKLVICKYDEDPKDATFIPIVSQGQFKCEIEDKEIYKYKIIDFGEVLDKGFTSRSCDFYVEDDALIDIKINGNDISIKSNGIHHNASDFMEQESMKQFEPQMAALENLPDSVRDSEMSKLDNDYANWLLDYYSDNLTMDFLFELSKRLSSFIFFDKELKNMLDIYRSKYQSKFYPDHSIHRNISELANSGLQLIGGEYHDYKAFDLNGNIVNAYDFIPQGNPTVIVIWATWCSPCRREAIEMIPIYERYKSKGVYFLGLAHEFKSTDKLKEVIEKDKHPWPTILDLDDRFDIFRQHGTTSNGILLIDGEGKIITAAYDFKEIQNELDKLL